MAGSWGWTGAAAGNRVIDGVSLAAFAKERAEGLHPVPGEVLTSVRNSFAGIVTAVILDDVIAQVEIQSGPHRLVSVVSREAVEELGIRVGVHRDGPGEVHQCAHRPVRGPHLSRGAGRGPAPLGGPPQRQSSAAWRSSLCSSRDRSRPVSASMRWMR